MLSHEYRDMPGKEDGKTVLMLRCVWCMKTPTKARADGCPIHELAEVGSILLSEYNPEGVARFGDRSCSTCELPIMGHMLRKGSPEYWCYANHNQFSDGLNKTVWDVPDGLGKQS